MEHKPKYFNEAFTKVEDKPTLSVTGFLPHKPHLSLSLMFQTQDLIRPLHSTLNPQLLTLRIRRIWQPPWKSHLLELHLLFNTPKSLILRPNPNLLAKIKTQSPPPSRSTLSEHVPTSVMKPKPLPEQPTSRFYTRSGNFGVTTEIHHQHHHIYNHITQRRERCFTTYLRPYDKATISLSL